MCTYWHSLDQSWVPAKGLAPSPAAEEIFPSACQLRRNLPAHCRAVRSHLPFAPHQQRHWVKSLSPCSPGFPQAVLPCCCSRSPRGVLHRTSHAALDTYPCLFSKKKKKKIFLAMRRSTGAAPILLVVKVPQHFLGTSGSVEK